MSDGRGTEALFDSLHGLLAGALKDELLAAQARSKDRVVNGETVHGEPINPQLLDKIMKFLKDNGVNAPKASKRIDSLATELQSLDLDEEAMNIRMN